MNFPPAPRDHRGCMRPCHFCGEIFEVGDHAICGACKRNEELVERVARRVVELLRQAEEA